MWQACLFHGTYLFNTRMHFADIWFCFHSFWKCIIHVLKNIFTKVSLYARIILIMSKYLSELIAVWMWPQSQCEAHPESNIWGQLSWGVNRNYGEGDTGHEQHEQMNCMSYIISRPLTPAFPHLTFPRTSLRSPRNEEQGQDNPRSQYFRHFLTGASRPFGWVKYVCVMAHVMYARVFLNTLPRDKKCCPRIIKYSSSFPKCLVTSVWCLLSEADVMWCHCQVSHISHFHNGL